MSEDVIAPTAAILEGRLGGTVDRSAINAVLAALHELRKEYKHNPMAFQERHSPSQTRFAFDPRILVFVADAPEPAGAVRFRDGGMGGRMS